MKITIETVVCKRPHGCGWSWQRRVTRQLLRRPVVEYWGPRFEDGHECGRRWQPAAVFEDEYGDCLRHLQVIPLGRVSG